MKKLSLLSFLAFCLFPFQTKAQTLFNTMDSLDINSIHAAILVHGDMWWDPPSATARCRFPAGSPASINFAGAIWMSGYDAGNNLHVAAQTYRQDGNDYWPGPLDASGSLTYATSQKWDKIWKVNGTDVIYFKSLSLHTTTNTPAAILTWPAKGNVYAQGYAGASLTITNDMAPFVDLNGNGIYEPLQGEYPDFPGDQALWWVFSDNGPTHTETKGRPLGVEVHAMAYGYNRGTLIDNVVYYDYTIVNRSANNYHNFRLAQWDDIDLGYYLDDFIGFDSTWRLGICYNGTSDDGASGGHPLNSYGTNPPVTGLTFVSLPEDAGINYIPVGAFVYYNNDASIVGEPKIDTQFDNYIRAKYLVYGRFTDDFQGPGVPSDSVDTLQPITNYVYPGDPSDKTQFSECSKNNATGDRRFILSSNDFPLNAGSSQHIVLAQVVTDSAGSGGCPYASFAGIRRVADTAWNNYYTPPSSLHRPATSVAPVIHISAYPNPVHDILYLEDNAQNIDAATITVYNFMGQVVNIPTTRNGQKYELNISALPYGLYNIRYRNGNTQANTKFMKE